MQLKWVEKLFSRLLAIYGDRFSSMWASTDKTEMKEVWADALGGFTAEQIGKGISRCLDEPHAPNLPTFISYCRTYALSQVKQIPHNEMDTEKAKAVLAQIKTRYFKGKTAAAGDKDDF